jgi:transcriptional regulator with XRE-family HTH domain
MDGRKFDWIRQQLGLSKVELARQLGISRQSLYRCIWEGPPRVVALAILGLWYQTRMGGLLDEPSEPTPKRKPKAKEK